MNNEIENALDEVKKDNEKNQMDELARNCIYLTKNESDAKFYCKLCNYHCNTIDTGIKHTKTSPTHLSNMSNYKKDLRLRDLVMPNELLLKKLSNFLIDFYNKNHQQNNSAPLEVFMEKFKENFLVKYPDAKLSYKFENFVDNDDDEVETIINLNIKLNESSSNDTALQLVYKYLVDNKYIDVLDDESQILVDNRLLVDVIDINKNDIEYRLCVTSDCDDFDCVDTITNDNNSRLDKLILFYMKLDERVKVLAFLLRHLANMCQMDKVDLNMIPSNVYSVMTIYFLQTINPPILPIIHEIYNKQTSEEERNLPFEDHFEPFLNDYANKRKWKSPNTDSIGLLWLKLLAYYSLDYTFKEVLLSVRTHEKLLKSDLKIHGKKLAIEDPFDLKHNLCRTLMNQTSDYLFQVMLKTFQYFMRHLTSKENKDGDDCSVKFFDELTKQSNLLLRDYTSSDNEYQESKIEYVQIDENVEVFDGGEYVFKSEISENYLKSNEFDENNILNVNFTAKSIGCEKGPPLVCSMCNKEGHLISRCPSDLLPKLDDLPQITPEWSQILTKLCHKVTEMCQQNNDDDKLRNSLLERLENIIKRKYDDVELTLFGSSNNGFCMRNSDLDICMTLKRKPPGQKNTIDIQKIIKNISGLLRGQNEFSNIDARMAAKVPIVKFFHKKTGLEGDISVYNTLALHNTELLRAYTKIDKRTIVLGNVVKHFAKVCHIGDASCGSLSSYGYIIMMIHYLMKCDPPVLPCLQKLESELDKANEHHIDGWNCWFFKDLDSLPHVWSHHGKNKASVGELWLGFLRYYTETFDWKTNVVTIRDNNVLTRKAKNWIKPRMAIEDPFELSHNLAAGISHRMGVYILSTFIKARSMFGNVNSNLSIDGKISVDQFFSSKLLVDGYPPSDRNCYTCGKIGHMNRECPNVEFVNKRRAARRLKQLKLNDQQTKKCFNCGKEGHIKRDCTANQYVQSCHKCSQNGHIAADCPQQKKRQPQQPQSHQPQQQQPKPQQQRKVYSSDDWYSYPNENYNQQQFYMSYNNPQSLASLSTSLQQPINFNSNYYNNSYNFNYNIPYFTPTYQINPNLVPQPQQVNVYYQQPNHQQQQQQQQKYKQ